MELKIPQQTKMVCVDLFSGGGGLSLGFLKAGFQVHGYEIDKNIVITARQNGLNTTECNIFDDDFLNKLPSKVDVVVGGPPCQPFSQANLHAKGQNDTRNGVDRFLDVVECKQPSMFIMEESPRLMTTYRSYLDAILLRAESFGYKCQYKKVNMDKFLVPQSRQRLILVGARESCDILFDETEKPTCIQSVLTREEVERVTKTPVVLNENFTNSIGVLLPDTLKRIYNYEKKCSGLKFTRILNLEKPSRTLTVTGLKATTQKSLPNDGLRFAFMNNQLIHKATVDEGLSLEQRPLTVSEMKRIQTFPDAYHFPNRKVAEKIIGNSVPPMFAYIIAERVHNQLKFK